MSQGGDWKNRPLAREEMQKSTPSFVLLVSIVAAVAIAVSFWGLMLMFAVNILNDAGAVDWSMSYRQAQLFSLCIYLIFSTVRYAIRHENTPTQ
jgi:hypothetical protein